MRAIPIYVTGDNEEGDELSGIVYDGEASARLAPAGVEDGDVVRGALAWLNSARITTDPDEDSVTAVISIGDPRGGFGFTIRRNPSTGEILLHMPHPSETWAHMQIEALHPGTYRVIHDYRPDPTKANGPEAEMLRRLIADCQTPGGELPRARAYRARLAELAPGPVPYVADTATTCDNCGEEFDPGDDEDELSYTLCSGCICSECEMAKVSENGDTCADCKEV